MPEGKDSWIMVRLEPSFRALVSRVERECNMSASAYARSAIIRDLHARGLLSADALVRITSMSNTELFKLLESSEAATARDKK